MRRVATHWLAWELTHSALWICVLARLLARARLGRLAPSQDVRETLA